MENQDKSAAVLNSATGERAQASAGIGQPAHHSRTNSAPRKAPFPFTPKALDALKFTGEGYEVRDALCPGLSVRVGATKKSWSFMFDAPGGGRARLPLGTYPATAIKDARDRVMEARRLVEAGQDPRKVEAPAADITMADLVDERVRLYLRMDANNSKKSCLEIERCYDVAVIPLVGAVAVKDFRIRHLKMVTNRIMEAGHNRQANIVHQHVCALTAFAVRQGHIDLDPLSAAKPPARNATKDRWLALEEITQLWNGADDVFTRSQSATAALHLILATLQRPGEVLGMTRQEVDTQKRLWVIPADRAKSGREHHVPLNDLAMAIVADRLRQTNGDFLFPNVEGDGPIPNYTLATTLARALEADAANGLPLGRLGIAKFTPHDLRRTGATHMSLQENGLQIDELHIGHVLNHRSVTKATVTARVYNQNQYLPEKREALDKWGAFLAKLVGAEQMQVAA